MKINSGYQRYRIIPHELRFGYGYTRDGLRCVRVWVRYGKIPPAVYPCSTLPPVRTSQNASILASIVCHVANLDELIVSSARDLWP